MILQLENDVKSNLDVAPLNNRYNVVLTPTRYNKKPSNYTRIHDELNNAKTVNLTLYELLEEVAKGRTWRNGIYDYPELKKDEKALVEKWHQENNATTDEVAERIRQYHIKKEHKKNVLVRTNLAVLDVDDVLGKSDPVEVMKETGAIALYYTFSHNRMSTINDTENRYRLLYDLSESVTSKGQLEYIQESIRKNLLKKYPYLNDQKIGNKSHGVENLTTQFHGTNKGYEINTDFVTYEVAGLIEQHEREQAFEQSLIVLEKTATNQEETTADEILDVANFLGDLNDILSFDEWRTLAIGLWNTAQLQDIDDSVIIEALEILNGHEKGKDEKYYLGFKRPLIESASRATIGTLYKVASAHGYKRKPKEQPPQQDKSTLKNVKSPIIIDEFIGADNFLKLLTNDDKRILLVSDTGTGKTRSAIDASRELNKQNKDSFVYIALPVIPLSEQTERKYGTNTAIIGTNKVNTKQEVKKAINNDTRLLIGTYNKTDEVCSYLDEYNVTVIADEAHKEITDYNFRHEAINKLFSITDRENVTKFVAMTGTPSEIDFNAYDSIAPFELKEPKVLADKLQFIEYVKANSYEKVTARAIVQEVDQGRKVLAFVDNKKVIRKLAKALRKQGLKVSEIKADNRKSKTYRNLLDNEKFDDATDVILSTRLLADGINIQNTKEYVLMIAPNHYKQANFYNLDLIRQASNRFRNQYEKIMILLYVNQDVYQDDSNPKASQQPYNLEYQYNNLLRTAKIIQAQSESTFKDNLTHFTPSIAEKLAGLFKPKRADNFNFRQAYDSRRLAEQGLPHDTILLQELEQLEQDIFTIDKRHIRNLASQDKERYYSLYPYAFKKALIESLEVLKIESIQAHEYFLNNDTSLAKVLDEITALETESNKEKRNDLKTVLHELIYHKIQQQVFMSGTINESVDEWKLLKEKMNSYQYTALKNVIKFLNYEQALKELEYVEKQAQTNELVKGFEAITEMRNFKMQDAGKEQVTKKIFKAIHENIVGKEFYSVAERDALIERLAKDYKIKRYTIAKRQELFNGVFKRYFVETNSRQKKVNGKNKRIRSYKVINFKHLAQQREVSTAEITKVYETWYKYAR